MKHRVHIRLAVPMVVEVDDEDISLRMDESLNRAIYNAIFYCDGEPRIYCLTVRDGSVMIEDEHGGFKVLESGYCIPRRLGSIEPNQE